MWWTLLLWVAEALLKWLVSQKAAGKRLSASEAARVNKFIYTARQAELVACDVGCVMGGTPYRIE